MSSRADPEPLAATTSAVIHRCMNQHAQPRDVRPGIGCRSTSGRLVRAGFVGLFTLTASSADAQSRQQVDRLATLGKVWGFLKYYHPGVAAGTIHWDSVLVATVPKVKAARTSADFQATLRRLLDAAGTVRPCVDSTAANADGGGGRCRNAFPDSMRINLDQRWMSDARTLGTDVVRRLAEVRDNRHQGASRYVSFGITAQFDDDTAYRTIAYPGEAQRLLALFRFWNAARYYFPYMYVNGGDWNDVLPEFIPRMMATKNGLEYHLTAVEMATRIRDTHVNTVSAGLNMASGTRLPGFEARMIEGKVVVWRLMRDSTAARNGLRAGDVITHINGATIEERRQELSRFIAAGSPVTFERKLIAAMLRSRENGSMYTIDRGGPPRTIWVENSLVPSRPNFPVTELAKVLPNSNFGYINMGDINQNQVDSAYAIVKNTDGLVMDVRNYPRLTMYRFAALFNPIARPFAKFTMVDSTFPGQVVWVGPSVAGPRQVNPDPYRGRIAILADERTLSHAEFSVMALQTSPQNKVIGSPTAGADGNVTQLSLPGGLTTMFSGVGVYYPDGKETQRSGLSPDIEIRPTIKGIRAGRDEVLERALEYLKTGQ